MTEPAARRSVIGFQVQAVAGASSCIRGDVLLQLRGLRARQHILATVCLTMSPYQSDQEGDLAGIP
jgi:hypothetical protein